MSKVDLGPNPPYGQGHTLGSVGFAMILLSLAMGAVALFTLGKVTTVEPSYYGIRKTTEWVPANIAIILASTAWTTLLSFAVMRLGSVLHWLEAINQRAEPE